MSASLIVAQKIKTTAIEGEKIVEKIICQQKEIKEFEESAKEILSKIPAAIGNASAQKIESVCMLKRIGCPQKITDKFEEDFENLQTQYKKVEGILNRIKKSCHSKYSRINQLKDLFQLVTSKPNITEIETLRKNHNDLASQVHNGYLEILNIEAELTSMANANTSKALSDMNSIVEDTNKLYAQLLNSLVTACTIASFLMADENSNIDNDENSNIDNSENTSIDNIAIGYILFMWSSVVVSAFIIVMLSFFEGETNTSTRLTETTDSTLLSTQLPVAITTICAMSAATAVYFWNKNRTNQHQEQLQLGSGETYRAGPSNS